MRSDRDQVSGQIFLERRKGFIFRSHNTPPPAAEPSKGGFGKSTTRTVRADEKPVDGGSGGGL